MPVSSRPTPILSHDKHSGIPARFAEAANASKARLYSNRTLPESRDRTQEVPVLPPDVTRETFNKAITDLKDKLGSSNIEINDKPLVDGWYMEHPNTHDAFHITDQEDLVSSAAVYPASTEDVQTIMRWANQYLIPIYPISMGRNLGYGGSAPRLRGGVVVDLGKRMNKILKLDASNATCMVEPGVSYFALYDEIQKRGLPLWIDSPDLGGGSVLGNAIDRGVGYTPYGDHFANHCGMEVVLPTGEVLRTGMGSLPGKDDVDNPTWTSFQAAYGPYTDGIFSQSNFGIVTKMGMWLMPAPEGHQTYAVTFPRDEDFAELVDIIQPLALNRTLGNLPQLRHVLQELAVTGKSRKEFYDGPGVVPREIIRQHAKSMPMGDISWVLYGTVYGPESTMKQQLEVIKTAFSKISGSNFFLPEHVPANHYLHNRAKIQSGFPELRDLDWLNWWPNAGHLFFSPITPTNGSDAQRIYDLVHGLHNKWGIDSFPTFVVAGREMHYIANIVFDRGNLDQKRRVDGLMRELIQRAADEGYGEYRTHLLYSDQVARTYSWNTQALMRFNETLKDTLDPNGILAPGKCGIWPQRFRGRGFEIMPDDRRVTRAKL